MREQLYDAGYKSAYFWCAKEAEDARPVRHGGVRALPDAPVAARLGPVHLRIGRPGDRPCPHPPHNSSFVLAQPEARDKLCYMFAGWFSGAMDWVGKDTGRNYLTISHEAQCAAEGCDHCVFTVEPK